MTITINVLMEVNGDPVLQNIIKYNKIKQI